MEPGFDDIKHNIETGDLVGVVSQLLELTQDRTHPFHKEVILHSASLQQILKEERLGTQPAGYINRERKRLALAILDLLDVMEKEQRLAPGTGKNTGTGLKVFLCHSSGDKAVVKGLYDRLKLEADMDPWLDTEKLLPGLDWDLEIRSALQTAHVILICLSRSSVSKEGYVQKEIRRALDVADEKPDGTIFLIPVRLEACDIPVKLRQWQWLDLFEKDSYEKLLISLKKRARGLEEQERNR
jgi:hypothetical protein